MCTYTTDVINKGIEQGRAEIIGNLLQSGKSAEEIHQLIFVPLEEVRRVEASFAAENKEG